jgi:hypothetical protein
MMTFSWVHPIHSLKLVFYLAMDNPLSLFSMMCGPGERQNANGSDLNELLSLSLSLSDQGGHAKKGKGKGQVKQAHPDPAPGVNPLDDDDDLGNFLTFFSCACVLFL